MLFSRNSRGGSGTGRGAANGGMGRNRTNAGLGKGGLCICSSCGASVSHQRGIPCYNMKCPNCGAAMVRDGLMNQTDKTTNIGKPTVSKEQCIGCGKCIPVCPYGAISMVGDVAFIDHNKCIACNKCIAVCPTGAIK